MYIVAYSGSNITEWSLNTNGTDIITFNTEELNPLYVDNYTIVRALMNHFPSDIDPRNVSEVFFYGTGCETAQLQQRIVFCLESFFEEAKVNVESDLEGATKGVYKNKSGLLAIIGTSASACAYDGHTILEKSTSLNYHIGNEGSSIHIGTQISRDFFYNAMPSELSSLFEQETGVTSNDLSTNLARLENPTLFLSNLATFAGAHKEHPYIKELVAKSFQQFINLHLIPLSEKTGITNVAIIGSVGFLFEDLLHEALEACNLQVEKKHHTPIKELLEYHQSQI